MKTKQISFIILNPIPKISVVFVKYVPWELHPIVTH